MKAVRVHATGGPAVLKYEDVPAPEPGAGQAVVKIAAAGVNFVDVYQRRGLYPVPLPFTAGQEAAGTVTQLGSGAGEVKLGDRVAYMGVLGAYAELAVVPVDRLVPLPEGVSAQQAAALMLQGMTAHYLATSTYPLKPGDTCLVHAAAGGVGLLLCQIAKLRGARVIGTVSTAAKAELAREAGADDVVRYTERDFVADARRLTAGRGVDVVYDSVGKTTFDGSLAALRPRGLLVPFGQSSGPVPLFDLQRLNQGGSLFITRPSLYHYTADRAELELRAGSVLGAVGAGQLKVRIGARFPLAQAAAAHRALEGRATTGKVLLVPG